MRIGLIGGTFDPIHQGHIDVAREARAALDLDRVWFVPAGLPSHRQAPVAPAAHRFAMVALALVPFPEFLVSDADLHDESPVYTDHTLARWSRREGVAVRDLFFITGADAFEGIRTWKNYPAVLDRAHFVAVSRPGHPVAALASLLPELAGRMRQTPCQVPETPAILLVNGRTTDASSTAIRARLASGQPTDDALPEAIAAYIRKYGLYGGS